MPLFNNDDTTTEVTETTEEVVEEVKEVEKNIPSIDLIIEDGTGVSNANSYCDLDFALEYCTMKGYTDWQELTEDEQKVFIIRGTEFVDNYFNWKGVRKYINQSLSFPRERLNDGEYRVEGIPSKLKKACLEAAWLNVTSGADTLFSSKDSNGKIKRQKVDSLEVEYFDTDSNTQVSSSQVDYTTIYDILNKLVKGLYKTGTQSKICSRVINTDW